MANVSKPFFSSNITIGVIEEVDIFRIKQSPLNELRFDLVDVNDSMLANSIRERGLLQPIIIRTSPDDRHFEIVAGNRRYNACKSLGYRKIACHVVELDDKAAFEVALIENIQ